MNCGSQAALEPPKRKRKQATILLEKEREKKGKMEEARIKYQSRTFILHTHWHLTKVLEWHNLSETSFFISQHRW
jgi:hypothetical protein